MTKKERLLEEYGLRLCELYSYGIWHWSEMRLRIWYIKMNACIVDCLLAGVTGDELKELNEAMFDKMIGGE